MSWVSTYPKDYLETLYRGSWAITAATEMDNE